MKDARFRHCSDKTKEPKSENGQRWQDISPPRGHNMKWNSLDSQTATH